MPRKARILPRMTVYRQSDLQGFTKCPRRLLNALLAGNDLPLGFVGHTGQLGTAFHEFMRRYMLTIQAQDAEQMPTQEAIETMYEVLATLDFTLPFEALEELRWLVLGFCRFKWDPSRIFALEQRLTTDIVCPDGITRTLKGQPDILYLDPPDGLIVIDAKTGRGRPKGPRLEPEPLEVVEGREYLSDLFQGDTYSLLGLDTWPAAMRVIFRQLHLRSGQIRQGTLDREGLEHVRRGLAITMMQLDRAIQEGPNSALWKPRPGSHCARQCPVSRSCPIPREMRGAGGIATPMQADAAAKAFAVLEGQRETLRVQLKEWVEDPVNPVPSVNAKEVMRWEPEEGKGRRFGVHPRRAA
jgi:hypothetical protein